MRSLRYSDFVIISTALLTGIGLIAIFAASSLKATQLFDDQFFFFRKQLIAAAVGFTIIFLCQRITFHWFEKITIPLLFLTIFFLSLIFIPGVYTKIGGAERWLRFSFIAGQPSELAKLALILFLAKNLSRPTNDIEHFKRGILPNLAILGILTGLLLLQKDLGTAFVLCMITGLMLFVAGISKKLILTCGSCGVLLAIAAVCIEPYRVQRIMTFLDPWSSARGAGFQIIQSFLAFRNGGLFGAGLGESRQKLFYLPEAHTDFILAVIGEELGIFGILVLAGIFLFLGLTGFRIASGQTDPHRRFLAFGITSAILLQSSMNMGVTMGLLPTKGIPLPFISSGNSSLLVFLCMSAILAHLGKDLRPTPQESNDGSQSNSDPII